MTLDEAIKHCEEVAQEKRYEYQECLAVHDMGNATDCEKCGEDHKQLAEWLTELKARRSFFRCYVEACENNTGGGCRRDYIEIEECGTCRMCGEVVPLCKQYEAESLSEAGKETGRYADAPTLMSGA